MSLTVVSPDKFYEELEKNIPYSQALIRTFQHYTEDAEPYQRGVSADLGHGVRGRTSQGYALRLSYDGMSNPFASTKLLLRENDSDPETFEGRVINSIYLVNSLRISTSRHDGIGGRYYDPLGPHVVIDRTALLLPEPNMQRSIDFGRFVYEAGDHLVQELHALQEDPAARNFAQAVYESWRKGARIAARTNRDF